MQYVPYATRDAGFWVAPAPHVEPCNRRGITALDPQSYRRLRTGIEHVVQTGSTRALGELIVQIIDDRLSVFETLAELDKLQLLDAAVLRHFYGCEWPVVPVDAVPT